jgi:hypothetical protein
MRFGEAAHAQRLGVGIGEHEQQVVVERRPGLQHAQGFQQRAGGGGAVGRAERGGAGIVARAGQHHLLAAGAAALAHDDIAHLGQRDAYALAIMSTLAACTVATWISGSRPRARMRATR